MSAKKCQLCNVAPARIKRPKNGMPVCHNCFFVVFEEEIHHTIVTNDVFKPGERVAIGASGGKDSTVLAHVMTTLNQRYNYGLHLELLSVDEGIKGYRDDSLETVKKNQQTYQISLTIVSYKDLYGWTMDEIVQVIGLTNNCTFCGVFRRQALERGAMLIKADKILTGHNADDIAETVYMNILRGDFFRLGKCVDIVTGRGGPLPRAKPFKYTYEKEIVMYAHFKKLDYFSTECIYSPNAYRGHVRQLIKDLEVTRPSTIIDIIHSAESLKVDTASVKMPTKKECERCGFVSSNKLCKACVLLEGLNSGKTRQAMGRKDGSKPVAVAYEEETKS